MKFCKNLQRVVDISDPEWAPYWTNYKMLKKLIKELPSLVPGEEEKAAGAKASLERAQSPADSGGGCSASASASSPALSSAVGTTAENLQQEQQQDRGDRTGETSTPLEAVESTTTLGGTADSANSHPSQNMANNSSRPEELGRNPGEVAFFKLLHAELRKAIHFFSKAEQEFAIREERVREGMEIMKRPNSIMVNEKWSMLAKSIYRLYKDLLLLETFAIMTYCSFSKILKKHDKVTGHSTREAFMANVVSKANFTSYPKVLEMISRCETLYEEVSDRLVQEGKHGLYEDERLFINMISRLNDQAMDNPDAPPEGRASRRPSPQVNFASPASSTTDSVSAAHHQSSGKESEQVARLRSLVEENEARSAHVSEGVADDDGGGGTGEKKKRGAPPEDSKPKAADSSCKRVKKE